MLDKIKAIIQLILPKQCLTHFAGWLAEKKWGFFTHWMIKGFAKLYRVDLSEAKLEKAEEYSSFNEFFARELKEGKRPVDENPNSLVSPADGKVSQFGDIRQDDLLQAKGHFYSLSSLVACDDLMSQKFYDGHFITTYLSPKDYHRVHMPCDAELKEMIYVPGSLYSVNEATTRNIDNIFARNERIICLFETAFGPMIQILVGATIVGTIETTWQGKVTPPRDGLIKKWHYTRGEVTFKKGDEMGCFKLGSTVINLFTKDAIVFKDDLTLGQPIKMGKSFGNRR